MEERRLGRIAVLLLALAALAERAGGRAAPVRCFVLFFLRHAEAVATGFVLDAAPHIGCAAPRSGDGAEDAARLAGRLRALAAIFVALSLRARRTAGRRGARRPGAVRFPAARPTARGHVRPARRSRAPPAARGLACRSVVPAECDSRSRMPIPVARALAKGPVADYFPATG